MKKEDMTHRAGLLRWAFLGAVAVALGATACFGLLTGASIVQGWGYLTEPETDSLSHAEGLLLAGGLLLVLALALAVRFLPGGRPAARRRSLKNTGPGGRKYVPVRIDKLCIDR